MAELPYMKFYVDDYEAATTHLSLEEDGAYNRLLRLCWRQPDCTIPNDPDWICRMLRVDKQSFSKTIAPLLAEFFSEQRGRLFQKRQRAEFLAGNDLNAKRRAAGKKGGKAKALKSDRDQTSNANDLPEAKDKQTDGKKVAKDPITIAITRTITKESSSPTPPPTSDRPKPDADDDFEKFDKALRAIKGLDQHPVAVAPVIAPIWQLALQGYNLKTEIIPAIQGVLAKSKPGAIRSWGYFREAIVEQRGAVLNGQHPKSVPATAEEPIDWAKCLVFARKHQTWDPRVWGPYPNKPGCLVPPELIVPTDGEGWIDYERWRTA